MLHDRDLRARLGVVAEGEDSKLTGRPPIFYGGAPGLEPGDRLPFTLGPVPYRKVVRVTEQLPIAFGDARRHQGWDSGDIYEVQPIGMQLRICRSNPTYLIFGAARVLRLLKRGVQPEEHPKPVSQAEDISAKEPLVGFRSWGLCGAPADGLLTTYLNTGYNFPHWQPGINHFGCVYDHLAGSAGCPNPEECGAIFFESLGAAAEYARDRPAVFAAVRGWGRASRGGDHPAGGDQLWRTEYGELSALWVDPKYDRVIRESSLPNYPVDPATDEEWAARLADRYEIPLVERRADLEEVS